MVGVGKKVVNGDAFWTTGAGGGTARGGKGVVVVRGRTVLVRAATGRDLTGAAA